MILEPKSVKMTELWHIWSAAPLLGSINDQLVANLGKIFTGNAKQIYWQPRSRSRTQ